MLPAAGHLTAQQTLALEICTRTMSVLSLLGSCYIISTFLAFSFYRKPINRLVFYATWGNIMANVATLISTSGIPQDGQTLTPLCEFQAVLIQWFMMADSLWVRVLYSRIVPCSSPPGLLHGNECLPCFLAWVRRYSAPPS